MRLRALNLGWIASDSDPSLQTNFRFKAVSVVASQQKAALAKLAIWKKQM